MTSHSSTRIPREPRKVGHREASAPIGQKAQQAADRRSREVAEAVTVRQKSYAVGLEKSCPGGALLLALKSPALRG
jgi:hypothetical protein